MGIFVEAIDKQKNFWYNTVMNNNNETPIDLNNWCVKTQTIYDPPEYARLGGNCANHPNFPDGEFVYPSAPFKDWNPEKHTFRSFSGKLYRLGNPHPEYEAMYPDATFRLITSCFGDKLEF